MRKQHHAIDLVLKKLPGVLFPNRILTNDIQLDVSLNLENEQLKFNDCDSDVIPWYNSQLNVVQKQAVTNILQGVARPLPYVIFGPPG